MCPGACLPAALCFTSGNVRLRGGSGNFMWNWLRGIYNVMWWKMWVTGFIYFWWQNIYSRALLRCCHLAVVSTRTIDVRRSSRLSWACLGLHVSYMWYRCAHSMGPQARNKAVRNVETEAHFLGGAITKTLRNHAQRQALPEILPGTWYMIQVRDRLVCWRFVWHCF